MALDLAAVLLLSHDLQVAASLGAVVQAAQDAVRKTTGYATTWLSASLPGTPRTARVLAIRGAIEELVWELAPIFQVDGNAMLEEVWGAAHPVVLEDARTDPRTNKKEVEIFGNITLIHVPLLLGTERVGALSTGTFGSEGVRAPTPGQLESLVIIATLVAAALLRVRVQAALHDSEQAIRRLTNGSLRGFEQQRRRLSRELHDGVGQLLIVALLQLSELSAIAPEPAWSAKVKRTEGIITDAIASLRSLSHDLRPPMLDSLGLPAALHDLARSCTTSAFQVEVQLRVVPGFALPEEVAISLYRIAQIALANTVRHARAAHASIALEVTQSWARLEVVDHGVGFDPARVRSLPGIGLIGIQERAKGLGGSSEIASAPGSGTRVTVEVPLGR